MLVAPSTAAMVMAPEVPQQAVLFCPQHHVSELELLPQGLTRALLFPSYAKNSHVSAPDDLNYRRESIVNLR